MKLDRKAALGAVLLCLCLLGGAAFGQEAVTGADVEAALEELKEAPSHERREKWEALVGLGDAAADALTRAVQEHRQTADSNYIGHCILALGELKAEKATDVLIDVLDSNNMGLAYQAASVLGQIWEAKGSTDERTTRANAALLASLYSDAPPVARFGPALALVKVNGMPISRPASMEADELKAEIDRWIAANPGALPSVDEQPWQLNLRVAVTSDDPNLRRNAVQALRQKRELGPVEPVLAALAGGGLPQAISDDLAQLLGELTGVSFPPQGADTSLIGIEEQVSQWRALWLQKLKNQTDERHVGYGWRELERAVRHYNASRSDESASRLKDFRSVVISQLPDADAMPAGASANAKKLLRAPLEIKKRVAEAVAVLEGQPHDFEKRTQLEVIDEQVGQRDGRQPGLLFLSRLAVLARAEMNATVAGQMGNLLSKISGIPCDLDSTRVEKRRAGFEVWAETIAKIGLPLELPPE